MVLIQAHQSFDKGYKCARYSNSQLYSVIVSFSDKSGQDWNAQGDNDAQNPQATIPEFILPALFAIPADLVVDSLLQILALLYHNKVAKH
jgi:hypothetical protein